MNVFSHSLNTQSSIRRILVEQNSVIWAVWVARPVLKISVVLLKYEEGFFHVFICNKNYFYIFFKIVVSGSKTLVNLKVRKILIFMLKYLLFFVKIGKEFDSQI